MRHQHTSDCLTEEAVMSSVGETMEQTPALLGGRLNGTATAEKSPRFLKL